MEDSVALNSGPQDKRFRMNAKEDERPWVKACTVVLACLRLKISSFIFRVVTSVDDVLTSHEALGPVCLTDAGGYPSQQNVARYFKRITTEHEGLGCHEPSRHPVAHQRIGHI